MARSQLPEGRPCIFPVNILGLGQPLAGSLTSCPGRAHFNPHREREVFAKQRTITRSQAA